jgi:SAM-dependent methyltransferase
VNGSVTHTSYDRIGRGYARFRRPDPRIAARLMSALDNARTVVNIGAGSGSYEPTDRVVCAVEPSEEMVKQRSPDAALCIRAAAERLPLFDQSFDAAMAILTIHHWSDPVAGLRELVRVARRVIVFAYEPAIHSQFWLWQEYFPAAAHVSAGSELPIEQVAEVVGADRVETVPVPHDCLDGFGPAYWRRPAAYLDPDVRGCISGLARLTANDIQSGVERLRRDLDTGAWHTRHRDLLHLNAIDAGLRLIVHEPTMHETTDT